MTEKDNKENNKKIPSGDQIKSNEEKPIAKDANKTVKKKLEEKSVEKKSESKGNLSKVSITSQNDPSKVTKNDKTEEANSLKLKSNISQNTTKDNQKVKKSNDVEKKLNQNQHDASLKSNEQGEFLEKLVSINRVAKVVKGGRRFSFAALVVVGDGNGMVGHGKGKAKEVPEAIKKATDEAKSRMIRVPLRQGRTLHHDIKGRFDSGKVYLRSAPSGTGVIAGGPMRAVFEALGIQDIVAKSVGTSNPHNMIRATFEALKSASSPKIIAVRRNLKINDITKRRKIVNVGGENVKN